MRARTFLLTAAIGITPALLWVLVPVPSAGAASPTELHRRIDRTREKIEHQ